MTVSPRVRPTLVLESILNIQVLTNVRIDRFFLRYWVEYYGRLFGRENLHIMLDGDDWETDVDLSGVNIHVVRDVPRDRQERLTFTSVWQSRKAAHLLENGADVVLRTDIDEFVAMDPDAGVGLVDYLSDLPPEAMKAAFGLDVIHGPGEGALIAETPVLRQRRNAVLTREFCKLVAVRKRSHTRLRWVGGFHRARRTEIDIDPSLLLFHLALFDKEIAEQRISGRKTVAEHVTQGHHIAGRMVRFEEIVESSPVEFDSVRATAHHQLMASLPTKVGPTPGHIQDGNLTRGYHVTIPERFMDLLPPIPIRREQ